MKTITLSLAALSTLLPAVLAVSEWGQCGGIGWTGGTTCDAGLTCVYQNDWYSQCLRVTVTTSSVKTTSSSTKASSSSSTKTSSTSSTKASSTTSSTTTSSTGYVKVSGQKFTLNGATFNVVGTNAYWLAQLSSTALMTQAFSEIAQAGTTVVRTWGFNDVTSASGTYYQLWNGATPTINTGADGLQKFDQVVAAAKAAGIKLVVALTNNWTDYGGMDRYVTQIVGSGQAHSVFYSNAQVQAAYKNYITTFINRYKNEPTIMTWELANEPRCNACSVSVVTNWATTISAYIKSIDSNHLVALGDEGFFNEPGNASYPYQGGEGIDFVANLAISTLDYGTAHLYPQSWGYSTGYQAWGVQWIADHAAAQKTANKPVVLEEYGVNTSDRSTVYAAWWAEIESDGLAGDQYWQAGTTASGSGYNDGYAIFTTDSIFPAVQAHEAKMKARS